MRAWLRTEDGWAVLIGLALTTLGALPLLGVDSFGWVVKTNVWLDPGRAMTPASKAYAGLPGAVSLGLTYLFLLAVLLPGAWAMELNLTRFAPAFTVVFAVSYLCWLIGHNAYIAATPDKREAFGISWSLGLTGEAGFIVALAVGLVVGNFFPAAATWLAEGSPAGVVHQDGHRHPRRVARASRPPARPGSSRRSCFAGWPPSSRPT